MDTKRLVILSTVLDVVLFVEGIKETLTGYVSQKKAHYIGMGKPSIIYPERRRYTIRMLWYSIHFWLSVEYPRDHTNQPFL